MATIRSRCRIIKFQPLTAKDLKLVVNMGKISELEGFIAGSAARAIACNEIDVIKLYDQLLELIQSQDIIAFNKFADSLVKKTEQWELVTELLLYLFNRCLAQNKSIDEWFKIYDEFSLSLKQTEIYNLDKKQILFLAIDKISKNGKNYV